jgi:AP-2 complex subunit alpha
MDQPVLRSSLDVFGGSPSLPPQAITFDPSQVTAWFNKIVATNAGVLFENDVLQIGLKQEFRGSQGRLQLFYGNKSTQTLTQVSAIVKPVPFLRCQAEDLGREVAPKQQLKQQLMVESMQPFVTPPEMTVTYTVSGQAFSVDLKLPCLVSSFLEPVKLSADDFQKRWLALEGQNREAQDTFTASTKVDLQACRKSLTDVFKFGLVEVRYLLHSIYSSIHISIYFYRYQYMYDIAGARMMISL